MTLCDNDRGHMCAASDTDDWFVCREPEVPLRITPSNGFRASRSRRIRHRTSHRLHTRCSDGSAAPRFRGDGRLGDLGGVDSADSRHRQQGRTFNRILGWQLDCPRQAPTHRVGVVSESRHRQQTRGGGVRKRCADQRPARAPAVDHSRSGGPRRVTGMSMGRAQAGPWGH
jgi:hypothetical protein